MIESFSLKYVPEVTQKFLEHLESWCKRNTNGKFRDFVPTTTLNYKKEGWYVFWYEKRSELMGYGIDNNSQNNPEKSYQEVCKLINYDMENNNKEDLLAEAKRKYPPGTEYICAKSQMSSDRSIIKSDTELKFFNSSSGEIEIDAYGLNFVYAKGRWANIVSQPKVTLEEAQKRYPIGTIFRSTSSESTKIEVSGTNFYLQGNDILININSVKRSTSNWYVYRDGKWADIVTKPETLSSELPAKWAVYLSASILDEINFHRKRHGSNTISMGYDYPYIKYDGVGSMSNMDNLPVITNEQFIEFCRVQYGYVSPEKKVTEALPQKWRIKVTEENLQLVNALRTNYRKSTLPSVREGWKYIDHDGYGWSTCDGHLEINTKTFILCMQSRGILIKHENVQDFSGSMQSMNKKSNRGDDLSDVFGEILENNCGDGTKSKSTLDDYPPIRPSLKRKIPEVEFLVVKQRRII